MGLLGFRSPTPLVGAGVAVEAVVRRPTPRDEVWLRYLHTCAPLVREIVGELRIKASGHDRKDEAEDWHAQKELEIADEIERKYLKEEA